MSGESTAAPGVSGQAAYSEYVNPQWVRLLNLLEMNADYVECRTQICGNNFMVLKAAPPLNVSDQNLETFARSLAAVLEVVHSSKRFWQDALELAGRAIKV